MYVQEPCIFRFTHITYCGTLGFCMEIHRAQNATHASIESRFTCTWPVSSSGYVKTNRAVIIISLAYRTCDFNKRILIQLKGFEKK
jgi:hypothetical protein